MLRIIARNTRWQACRDFHNSRRYVHIYIILIFFWLLQGLPVTECIAEAALNACELVRVAQQHAFEERGRSMVASDIVRCLQPAVAEYWSV